jgi:FecR protein
MRNRPWACAVVTAVLLAGTAPAATPRFARLGSFEGPVEVWLDAADSWRPAAINLPLPESTRIRTGSGAKLEIELDDSNVFRMWGEGLAELSDYTRLSGGQRITVISLDHGLAYFTGEPGPGDSIHLLVPGAQASLKQGSRIRLQASDNSSEIAIVEGAVRFTMPSAEMDLRQGQSARVTIPESAHFSLFREITPLDSDQWNEQEDKAEAQAPASRLALDHGGKWIALADYGTVWQPAPQAGWAPYRQGRWIWFQSVGFTWVADEPWGWKPYHEGRWLQHGDLGWVWVPDAKAQPGRGFSPGDVFWARGNNLVAWGPLAPGEQWNGAGPPRQFAALNITGGAFVAGAREIVPSAPESLPKDLLKAFLFTSALPSPPLPLSRLNAARDALRTRLYSAVEVTPSVPEITQAAPPAPQPDSQPVADAAPPPPAPQPSPTAAPPIDPDPPDVVYPYPVYTGIVVVNPPDKSDSRDGRRNRQQRNTDPAASQNASGQNRAGGQNTGSTITPPPPATTNSTVHRTPPEGHRPDRISSKASPGEIHRPEVVPVKSETAVRHEAPAPRAETAPRHEAPPASIQAPAPRVEAPARRVETTAAPRVETAAPPAKVAPRSDAAPAKDSPKSK